MKWGPISLSNSVFWADISSIAPKLADVSKIPSCFLSPVYTLLALNSFVTVMAGKCGSRQVGSSGELTYLNTDRKQRTSSKWRVFKLSKPSLDSATNWDHVWKWHSLLGHSYSNRLRSLKLMWSSCFSLLSVGESRHWQPKTPQPVCTLFILVDIYVSTYSCLTGSCLHSLKTEQNFPCVAHKQWLPLYVFSVCYRGLSASQLLLAYPRVP